MRVHQTIYIQLLGERCGEESARVHECKSFVVKGSGENGLGKTVIAKVSITY